MILAAALLVLVGLGLFVGGLLTGDTVLYWACVASCVVAAGLLVGARRQTAVAGDSMAGDAAPPADGPGAAATATAAPAAPEAPGVPETSATPPAEPVRAREAAAVEPEAAAPAPAGATAVGAASPSAAVEQEEDPPVEEVEVTDLLIVVDLTDEVLVVDEHPRYHVSGCWWLGNRTTIPLPLDEARTDGFTPCGVCRPDATLADRVRARRRSTGA